MKFRNIILAVTAVSALSAQAAFAQTPPAPQSPVAPPPAAAPAPVDPNKVVLTIGALSLTAKQYEDVVKSLPQQYQTFALGAGKRQFAENLVQLNLLSMEALKKGLDKDPAVQQQILMSRNDLLARAMFDDLQKSIKVDDAAVQAYYDAHKNEYESVKARHILIRVKGAPMPGAEGKPELTDEQALAKANDLYKKLTAGGDFAAIAKAESDDTGSAAQGGDLGEFRHGMMVPPFEQAAFAQKVGEIGKPVKSPFGYHIIEVTEHKGKSLADAKDDIEKAIRPEMARKAVEDMRTKATVKIDEGFFGPATPAAPSPAPVK